MSKKKKIKTAPFIYEGQVWQIIKFEDGVISKLMDKLMAQLMNLLSHYSKVLALRLDFRVYDVAENNILISNLLKRINQKLKKHYHKLMYYTCVREISTNATTPHYHAVFLFNGHKVNHPQKIIKMIIEEINNYHPNLGWIVPKHCYYRITRQDTVSQQAFIYRASYLAKVSTKDKRSNKTKNYLMSRNKPHEPNQITAKN